MIYFSILSGLARAGDFPLPIESDGLDVDQVQAGLAEACGAIVGQTTSADGTRLVEHEGCDLSAWGTGGQLSVRASGDFTSGAELPTQGELDSAEIRALELFLAIGLSGDEAGDVVVHPVGMREWNPERSVPQYPRIKVWILRAIAEVAVPGERVVVTFDRDGRFVALEAKWLAFGTATRYRGTTVDPSLSFERALANGNDAVGARSLLLVQTSVAGVATDVVLADEVVLANASDDENGPGGKSKALYYVDGAQTNLREE